MTQLNPRDGHIVLINTFKVKSGKAEALLAALIKATETTVNKIPGFVSANFHVSLNGKQVVNYAQWRSKADFDRAMQVPEFQAHMKEMFELIESFDPVLYELRYSHGA
ncbi:MAG: antibiotic biosynthesis monooxygenase [Methylobacteriaceae bacterium]|nr:antibiotic biosynthesis monooxygenase [Methylobacteriaceae bacterium]